jgi:S-adenosylmethionine synthetase
MRRIVISSLERVGDAVEVVERKGLGHPDTICDALAEALSRSLCREYRQRFGAILHHNVDKALLLRSVCGTGFYGGTVIRPIDIYLAGRAICRVGTEVIPVGQIAADSARAWLLANLHALDEQRHVRIHDLVRPGSQDLQMLFARMRTFEKSCLQI